jgi:hypothetical protein
VVAVGAGEGEGTIRKPSGEGLGITGGNGLQVARMESNSVLVRNARLPVDAEAAVLHRPLEPSLQLHGLGPCSEHPGAGAFEDSFEQALEVGE